MLGGAEAGGGTETEAPVSVDDVKVSDSVSVYKDDDDCSVVTRYLTVSQGNGAVTLTTHGQI